MYKETNTQRFHCHHCFADLLALEEERIPSGCGVEQFSPPDEKASKLGSANFLEDDCFNRSGFLEELKRFDWL